MNSLGYQMPVYRQVRVRCPECHREWRTGSVEETGCLTLNAPTCMECGEEGVVIDDA